MSVRRLTFAKLTSFAKSMMKRCLLMIAAAALLAAPAHAQSRKELAAMIADLEARFAVIENRVLTGDPAAVRLQQRVDELEQRMGGMTGEMERLAFENRRLRDDVRALSADLEFANQEIERLQRGGRAINLTPEEQAAGLGDDPFATREFSSDEERAADATIDDKDPFAEAKREAVRPLGATFGSQTASADDLYDLAHTRLLEGAFEEARSVFEAFLEGYPSEPRAGEARYWIGETHFIGGQFPAAADAYIGSLRDHPEGAKAPDAMVKLGAALAAMGQTDEACRTLSIVPQRYPAAARAVRDKAAVERRRAGCG